MRRRPFIEGLTRLLIQTLQGLPLDLCVIRGGNDDDAVLVGAHDVAGMYLDAAAVNFLSKGADLASTISTSSRMSPSTTKPAMPFRCAVAHTFPPAMAKRSSPP